jgi:hypothetical protein
VKKKLESKWVEQAKGGGDKRDVVKSGRWQNRGQLLSCRLNAVVELILIQMVCSTVHSFIYKPLNICNSSKNSAIGNLAQQQQQQQRDRIRTQNFTYSL